MSAYEEFLVQGPEDVVRAFVAGWAAGRDMPPDDLGRCVLFARDWHVHTQTGTGGLLEALRRGHATRLLVRDDVADALARGIEAHACAHPLRGRNRVRGASFGFSYEIYSRQEAQEVRALFATLPAGAELSPDYQPIESSDPKAAGVELYAPEHGYELKAHGTVSGELRAVLEQRERTRRHERIRAKDVVLSLAS